MSLGKAIYASRTHAAAALPSLLALLAVLVMLAVSPAMAQPDYQPPLKQAAITGTGGASLDVIIFSGNYPPYNIQKDGFIEGVGPSLIFEVFKRMGQQYTLRALPWNRAIETMREGEADAILTLFKTREREIFLLYPEEHLFMESNAFFTRNNSGITYNGELRRLAGKAISVVEGYSYGNAVDNADYLDLRPSVGDEKMIRMVLRGRYPLGIGNENVVSYYAYKEGLAQELVFLKPLVTNSPAYLAFSKKRHLQDLARQFSITLREFKETERYKELLAGYGIN